MEINFVLANVRVTIHRGQMQGSRLTIGFFVIGVSAFLHQDLDNLGAIFILLNNVFLGHCFKLFLLCKRALLAGSVNWFESLLVWFIAARFAFFNENSKR